MPSIITHGAVAFAGAARIRIQSQGRKLLLLASAACAMLPDIDYVGFRLGVPYPSMFGHRGFTHSLFFAALVALAVAACIPRARRGGRSFGGLFLLFFLATASHGFLDAMTNGGEGVAFFSPFTNHRFFFPLRPIMVSPLGVGAFLGKRGLLILIDESLLVTVPFAFALYARDWWRRSRIALLCAVAAWAVGVAVLEGWLNVPDATVSLISAQYPGANALSKVPVAGIRGGKLVTNFFAIQHLGLFNRRIETENLSRHWASGFWANWYGGAAGRWQDPNPTLLLRTLVGYNVPGAAEIRAELGRAATDPAAKESLFRLSPTEKHDLALGDYGFAGTNAMLALTHNSARLPSFWFGLCNGVAAAASFFAEPFRAVDVVNPDGFPLRFHPNDVKALLGFAMANVGKWSSLGTYCQADGPAALGCRVNAGAFFLVTMNRIALARDAFIVDGFARTRKQFYLFDAARVEMLSAPRSVPPDVALPGVKAEARVRFTMEFVSTLLPDKAGDTPPDPARGEGFYQRVGRVVVPRVLDATLALDQNGEVLGGAWLGREDVPDLLFFPVAAPALASPGHLQSNPALRWDVIQEIYHRSVSGEAHLAPLRFSR